MSALYEDPAFIAFMGGFLHPGGEALTRQAFADLALSERALSGRLARVWGRPVSLGAGKAPQARGRVLDVGCGAGATVALLRELGYEAYGIDACEALVAAAGSPYVGLGDAYCLQGRYDVLLYECVLSLLNDKQAALGAARGALAPGGKLLLHDLLIRAGEGAGIPGVPCASGALTKDGLFALLEGAGFSCVSFRERNEAFKSFLAAFIMEFGSAAPFYQAALGGCGGPGVKLGYFTSVWEVRHAGG